MHGGGGTADHWQEFAAHLDGFRVVAIDLPGHGASSDSSWHWEDALDELETLELDNPAVVGHSLGGMLAVRWGLRHPDCPGVVNLDGNGWPSTYPGLADAEAAAARSNLNAVFKAQADVMAAALPPEQVEMLVAQQPLPFGDLPRAQQPGVVKDLAGRRVVEFDGSHGMLFEDPQGLANLVAAFLTGA
ncbi:MAG TPA: alpha/beta fold hydrolase [Kribbella sp.]